MNLAAMIEAAARPPATATKEERNHARLANLRLGGPAQSAKAVARYRAVMEGRGWMTQRQIENALGYGSSVATLFLRKLLERELVERRNNGGEKTYSRKAGYEWRWK